MKKGQLMSQPFVYIFALIVGALILVYGISMVWDVINTAGTVEIGSFYARLDKKAAQYYSLTSGSSTPFQVSLPDAVTHVCIKNAEEEPSSCVEKGSGKKSCSYFDEDLEFLLDEDANVFIVPLASVDINTYTIDNLRTKSGEMLCVPNGMSIKLTSQGAYVEAS
ncbi:MAG: hypothetical protein ABIB71_01385 [Candidatus Woesearchaeota archaeon]